MGAKLLSKIIIGSSPAGSLPCCYAYVNYTAAASLLAAVAGVLLLRRNVIVSHCIVQYYYVVETLVTNLSFVRLVSNLSMLLHS